MEVKIILEPQRLAFNYVNHRGEYGRRRAIARELRFGTSEWWPGSAPQWHMLCHDMDKNELREFRVDGMKDVVQG